MSTILVIVVAVSVSLPVLAGLVAVVAIRRFRRSGIDMDMREFFQRLIGGGGFRQLGSLKLRRRLAVAGPRPIVIDLRDPRRFHRGHLKGAVSRPFDDFLKDLVVNGAYAESRDSEIVLVCDTGHMSRVAASIMAEDEGFSNVVNLRGGMKSWNRWTRLATLRPRWSGWSCCLRPALAGCCRHQG